MLKVRFHPLLLLVFFLFIALDQVGQFFILFFIVTIHEWIHIFVAKRLKLNCNTWHLLPVGQAALLPDLEFQSPGVQTLILLSGPLCNLIIGWVGSFFVQPTYLYLKFFVFTNMAIGFFNLLPIYPLDGSQVLYGWIAHYKGNLWAMKQILKISQNCLWILRILGFIQMILYPMNASLLFIWAYLSYVNQRTKLYGTYELYKMIKRKELYREERGGRGSAFCRLVSRHTSLTKILQGFSASRQDVFIVHDSYKEQPTIIMEPLLLNYMMEVNLEGTIQDYLDQEKG